jgi:hypothetical protein
VPNLNNQVLVFVTMQIQLATFVLSPKEMGTIQIVVGLGTAGMLPELSSLQVQREPHARQLEAILRIVTIRAAAQVCSAGGQLATMRFQPKALVTLGLTVTSHPSMTLLKVSSALTPRVNMLLVKATVES